MQGPSFTGEGAAPPQRQPGSSRPSVGLRARRSARRSPGNSQATQCGGRSPSSPGGPGRAWNPLAWGPAQRRPPRSLEGAARLRRRRQARAELNRGGRSPSPTGEARGGQGAHPGGVRPSAGLRGRARCRREGRAAKASPGQGRAGEEVAGGWGGSARAGPDSPPRCCSREGRALAHGRRQMLGADLSPPDAGRPGPGEAQCAAGRDVQISVRGAGVRRASPRPCQTWGRRADDRTCSAQPNPVQRRKPARKAGFLRPRFPARRTVARG